MLPSFLVPFALSRAWDEAGRAGQAHIGRVQGSALSEPSWPESRLNFLLEEWIGQRSLSLELLSRMGHFRRGGCAPQPILPERC